MSKINNINYPLNVKDIESFFKFNRFKKPNIVTYSKLDYDNLLNKSNGYCSIILYETGAYYGHWTLLFYDPVDKIIEFFDPYGVFIDDQLKYSIYPKHRKDLSYFLIDQKNENEFEINDQEFQMKGSGISTCGKHCCVRFWASQNGISKKEYDDYFDSYPLDERDELVNEMFIVLNKP